jgi:transposase InsO family protein
VSANDSGASSGALHGDPVGGLTDNGAVFTGRDRGHGQVALEATLRARGVILSHSRPYHPQTCGKVERFSPSRSPRMVSPPCLGGWPPLGNGGWQRRSGG